ncbi:hypothetical protein PSTG_19691, partial [Puccinia striiformis f. sp. tritici PST-78]
PAHQALYAQPLPSYGYSQKQAFYGHQQPYYGYASYPPPQSVYGYQPYPAWGQAYGPGPFAGQGYGYMSRASYGGPASFGYPGPVYGDLEGSPIGFGAISRVGLQTNGDLHAGGDAHLEGGADAGLS